MGSFAMGTSGSESDSDTPDDWDKTNALNSNQLDQISRETEKKTQEEKSKVAPGWFEQLAKNQECLIEQQKELIELQKEANFFRAWKIVNNINEREARDRYGAYFSSNMRCKSKEIMKKYSKKTT